MPQIFSTPYTAVQAVDKKQTRQIMLAVSKGDCMNFSLCFICPARFCEITEDAERGTKFLKNLLSPTLNALPLFAILDNVILDYSQKEHIYYVRVFVCFFTSSELAADYIEQIKLQLEGLMSHSLLECFWEVDASGC